MERIRRTLSNICDSDIIDGKFTVPEKITRINDFVFQGQTELREIDLQNVDTLGICAFRGCVGLTKVKMPKIKYLGFEIFELCTSIPRPNSEIRKEIYEYTLMDLKNEHSLSICLDRAINNAIIKYKQPISVNTCFPRFERGNAIGKFKGGFHGWYWWPVRNKKIRKEFLKWCYEDEYSNL